MKLKLKLKLKLESNLKLKLNLKSNLKLNLKLNLKCPPQVLSVEEFIYTIKGVCFQVGCETCELHMNNIFEVQTVHIPATWYSC